MDDQLNIPVALFVFNRPEKTVRVLDRIRHVRPKRMFAVVEGSLPAEEGEAERCRLAQNLIGRIDWPCEVKTQFSDLNLGCDLRISRGISWVFDQSPEAIFLDDGCMPSLGFFRFCQTLLELYRDDARVGMISGNCFLPRSLTCPDSYYFSQYPQIWGWAGWRRARSYYDFELERRPLDIEAFIKHFGSPDVGEYFYNRCVSVREHRIDTWHCKVTLSFVANSLLAVIPARNLVSNIGACRGATRTKDANAPSANMLVHEPDEVLRHPALVRPWEEADRYTEKEVYGVHLVDLNCNDLGSDAPGAEVWRPSSHWPSMARPSEWKRQAASFWRARNAAGAHSADEVTTAVVIDPALVTMAGHNYSAIVRVTAELSRLNVEHVCLASVIADANVRKLAAAALPTAGLWWRTQYTHGEFLKHARTMRDHIAIALNDLKRPPDLLVLLCCDAVQIAAIAEYYRRPSNVPTPHLLAWFLFTPHPVEPMDAPSTAPLNYEYREAFVALRAAIGDDRKITVVCETAALASAYSDITGFGFGVAPGPNLVRTSAKEFRQERQRTARIASLGHANEAKGYRLFPEAIKQVLSSDSRATFFIHGSLEHTDAAISPAVFDALSRMGPRVITSNKVLTAAEYFLHLQETNILVLPYDAKKYRTRGSGIFNEAREIGIPIIATRGCAFAQPAFDAGWGVEIGEYSSAGLARAILTALKRLPDLTARAAEAARVHRLDDVGIILPKVVSDIEPEEISVRAGATQKTAQPQ